MLRVATVGLCALICIEPACGPSVDSGAEDSESGSAGVTSAASSTGAPGVTSSGDVDVSTTESSTSASSVGSTETTGSTGSPGEVCPQPEEGSDVFGGIYSVEMETGVPHEVECDALGWAIRETRAGTERVVDLACTLPEGGDPKALELVVTTDAVDAELDALAGQIGLLLSYWQAGADFVGNPERSPTFALRSAEGELWMLSNQVVRSQTDEPVVDELEVGSPWYLEPEPEKYAAWNGPFGELFIRDVGCAARPGTRPTISEEIPWALEFESDTGPQKPYDQSVALVEVDGQRFHVFVAAAFHGTRGEDSKFPGIESLLADYLIVRDVD